MEHKIATQFFILALNPENGRFARRNTHISFSLTGALLMDYLRNGEISIDQKKIISSFSLNGDPVHDMIAGKIKASSKNRRISHWVSTLTNKSGFILKNLTLTLEKENILRIEQKKFLGLFPYRLYWLNDPGRRSLLVEHLRAILLHGRQPSQDDLMLLALVESSKRYRQMMVERGEARTMAKKNKELLKNSVVGMEISQAIREVQAAIAASVMTATMVSGAGH
jgi:golgi phosphoprotein 3